MMPGIDGFESTRRIKAVNAKQKIIVLTTMSIGEDKQKLIDCGFGNVIVKPFKINYFNSLIRSLIA